jgi:hypothetical protein
MTAAFPRPTRLIAALLAVVIAPLQGCPPRTEPIGPAPVATTSPDANANGGGSGASPAPGNSAKPVRSANWPFWPTNMRVHPLTRLVNDPQTSQQIIECRIEFQDSDGQTAKAVGQLTLQAYPDAATPTGSGAMQTWNQDLRDLQVNRRQYDDVTRTYLFRLQTTQPLPAGCEIRAFFLSSDGRRLNAQLRLRQ